MARNTPISRVRRATELYIVFMPENMAPMQAIRLVANPSCSSCPKMFPIAR